MPEIDRKLPFAYLLMGVLFAIIATIVLAGIWTSYETSASGLELNAERLRAMTESHINTSFRMIDTSLKIYDSTYNDEMEKAFVPVMAEYERAGRNPAKMDLAGLKSRIGGMDVYVINDSCIIEYTSKPADLGLDFKAIYPDFAVYLHRIWNTPGFYPDRVVPDWVNRTHTKFGYMPTPDHRYVIELGLIARQFADQRTRLVQYSDVVNDVLAFNPYLEEVLVFQKQKRLVDNLSYAPTPEESAMLDYILWENRTTQVVKNASTGKTVVWQVVDMRDPDYAADQSRFAKLTYNDALLADERNRLASLHVFAALLVLLTGGLLAITVSRRVSRPLEQLVEDVDAVAAGDLDHHVRPVAWHEFSALAEKTGVMVARLREQIRQREASEQRFTDLVQLLPQGIFEADLAGTFTFGNPVALQVFGYSAADLGPGLDIFTVIAPDDHALAREMMGRILAGAATEGTEYMGVRKDGSTFPIMVYSAPITEDGTVTGIRGTVVDITRLKRAEAEVRTLNAELEERVAERTRELEAFTYSVSHDLRSPLRAIDGYTYILLHEHPSELSEPATRYLDQISQNARRMARLIDDLLTFSRAGRKALSIREIDLAVLVAEVLDDLAGEWRGRDVSITVGDLAPCRADPVLLKQVFANLIGNAIKFTRNRAVAEIEIGSREIDGRTVYHVRDNGVGFDQTYANTLFQVFHRLHDAREYEGEGVGLAIVQRIIDRHGGRIWVESELNRGTTFFFTLPTA